MNFTHIFSVRKNLLLVSALPLLASFLAGCATTIKGTEHILSVNSNVTGATVTLAGEKIGTTPFSGYVKKSSKARKLSVSKPGYETKSVFLDSSIEPSFWWGNFLLTLFLPPVGPLGSTTDYATSSMFKYSPSNLVIDLEEKQGN